MKQEFFDFNALNLMAQNVIDWTILVITVCVILIGIKLHNSK